MLTSGSVREGQPGRLCRVLSASRTDSLVRGPMTTGWQLTSAAARASALNDAGDVSASSRCAGLCDRQGSAIPQAARTSVSCVSPWRDRRFASAERHGGPLRNIDALREQGRAICESRTRQLRKQPASFFREAKPHPSGCGTRPSGTHGAPLAERHVDDRSRHPQCSLLRQQHTQLALRAS